MRTAFPIAVPQDIVICEGIAVGGADKLRVFAFREIQGTPVMHHVAHLPFLVDMDFYGGHITH